MHWFIKNFSPVHIAELQVLYAVALNSGQQFSPKIHYTTKPHSLAEELSTETMEAKAG